MFRFLILGLPLVISFTILRVKHDAWRRKSLLFCSVDKPDMTWDPSSAPKLDFDECYYEVLEINRYADQSEIKKSFYKLVSKYHPDNKETEDAKRIANFQMMVLNNAYKILKDEELRVEYDRQLKRGLRGSRAGIKGAATNSRSPSSKRDTAAAATTTGGARRRYTTAPSEEDLKAQWQQQQRQKQQEEQAREDEYARSMFDDISEYLRRSEEQRARYADAPGQGYGDEDELSTRGKREKAAALERMLEKMERELSRGDVDWGEVTDQRLIARRLRDLQALASIREQLIDLEYEITAEEEEAEFRRSRERDISSYYDNFDPMDTPFGFTVINNRSPWRQNMEQKRNPKRQNSQQQQP